MKRSKENLWIVFFLLILLVTGCAETPQKVKEDEKRQDKKEILLSKGDERTTVNLTPVNEVIKNTPSTWKQKKGAIEFDGIVQVPNVTELYKWKIGLTNNAYQNEEKTREVFLKYFDDLSVREEEEASQDLEMFGEAIIFYDDEMPDPVGSRDEIIIQSSGKFLMRMLTDYWEDSAEGDRWLWIPMNSALPYEKNYFFDSEGKCLNEGNDTWELYDGEKIEVQNAMEQYIKFIEEYHMVEPDVSLCPDRISVFFNPEENCYFLTIHSNYLFEGVKVDDADIIEQNIKEYGNICRLSTESERMIFCGKKNPFWTDVGIGYQTKDKLEKFDEIISLEGAWELLTDKTADLKDVVIDRADLMYSIWYQPEGDTDQEWDMQMKNPPEMYATPVWRFLSYQDAQRSFVYYVDAVTGDVTAYNHAVLD